MCNTSYDVLIQHTTGMSFKLSRRYFLNYFCRTINFTVFLLQDFAASAVFHLCLPREISR
jgi:hypothetical protein